jgi:hypothetical protein
MGSGKLKRLRLPTALITLIIIRSMLAVCFLTLSMLSKTGIEWKSIPAEISNLETGPNK